MSLVDRTNEEIALSTGGPDGTVTIDADYDSSFTPPGWVTVFGLFGGEDFHFNMTYDEAELAYQRLGLVLGK